jgi:hypothetical protein
LLIKKPQEVDFWDVPKMALVIEITNMANDGNAKL